MRNRKQISYFSTKTYVVGTQVLKRTVSMINSSSEHPKHYAQDYREKKFFIMFMLTIFVLSISVDFENCIQKY